MKKRLRYYRTYLVIFTLVSAVFLLSQCVDNKEEQPLSRHQTADSSAVNFEDFAGAETCRSCHQDIFSSNMHTAHFQTSAITTDSTVKGNFSIGSNGYSFDERVSVKMEKRADGYYQVEYGDGQEKKARRMDVVVGSGTMGQSSLNWQNNHLFQMPITYFTAADQWSNSPGFPDRVVFNRVITSRCLECHTTFAKVISPPHKEPEEFDKNKFIYGVTCEKCHGPAAKHVQFQTQHPADTTAKFIVNPARLSRQQKLDLCALCHGGRLQKTKPSFSFTAGNRLSDYFLVDTFPPRPEYIDVHGNQYGLLRASKCFKMSDMTCNTCHDTHKNEKGELAVFSQRCMNCHEDVSKIGGATHRKLGMQVKTNCIDCHMEVKPSRAISVFLSGDQTPTAAKIRSHLIR